VRDEAVLKDRNSVASPWWLTGFDLRGPVSDYNGKSVALVLCNMSQILQATGFINNCNVRTSCRQGIIFSFLFFGSSDTLYSRLAPIFDIDSLRSYTLPTIELPTHPNSSLGAMARRNVGMSKTAPDNVQEILTSESFNSDCITTCYLYLRPREVDSSRRRAVISLISHASPPYDMSDPQMYRQRIAAPSGLQPPGVLVLHH